MSSGPHAANLYSWMRPPSLSFFVIGPRQVCHRRWPRRHRQRRQLIQRPVWPVLVVVDEVLGEDRSRCRRPKISIRSRHSRRMVPTKRSAKALARGARTGVRMIRMPSDRKTSSKLEP